jgi:vacuolar-type H+-ATPase subunit I/STV1
VFYAHPCSNILGFVLFFGFSFGVTPYGVWLFNFSVYLVIGGSLALVCRNLNDAISKFGGIAIVQEIGRKPFWLEVRFEGMQWVYELVQQMDSI